MCSCQSKLSKMEISVATPNPCHSITLGQKYLQCRCPMILGISPGNPFYYKAETLQRLLSFAKSSSDKILLFIPDKISEHNYRAVGSGNPEKSARVKANRLRNKCKQTAREIGLSDTKYSLVKWMEEIESNSAYTETLHFIKDLYQTNDEFRFEVQDSTAAALRCMANGRRNRVGEVCDSTSREEGIDIAEGAKYLLKELAFLHALSNIYERCDRFVLVYHRPWPVLEKYFGGLYDNVVKPSLGFVVFE